MKSFDEDENENEDEHVDEEKEAVDDLVLAVFDTSKVDDTDTCLDSSKRLEYAWC